LRDEDLNHGQSTSSSSVATTRIETTHGLTYLVARVIEEWQSVDAICLCCLTNGSCVDYASD